MAKTEEKENKKVTQIENEDISNMLFHCSMGNEESIEKYGLKAVIGEKSKGYEKTEKVFFSYGYDMLRLMNTTIRIAKLEIENHNEPQEERDENKEKDFKSMIGKAYQKTDGTLKEQTYDTVYNILKNSHYYKLDLQGATREEYEKMPQEEQDKIDYLSDDINETNGKKVSKSNMHTISGKGVDSDKISKIFVGDKDDSFSILQYTYKDFLEKIKEGKADYLDNDKEENDECLKTLGDFFEYAKKLEKNKQKVSTQKLGKESLEELKDVQFLDKIEKEQQREEQELDKGRTKE